MPEQDQLHSEPNERRRLRRWVDEQADRFEAAWQARDSGKPPPRIEDYLSDVAGPRGSELLQALLAVDLDYHRKSGSEPLQAEYEARFPEHVVLVRTAFDEWRASILSLPASPGHIPGTDPVKHCPQPCDPQQGQGLQAATITHVPGKGSTVAESTVTAQELTPGSVLGDYELLELLGKGGMGIVWKAQERGANRLVALKVIRPDKLAELPPAQHREWLERFKLEGQAAARLDHDHIVTVYRVGEIEGHHFYAMRYVTGQSLADLLHNGPLPNRRAASYVEPIARAVHHAHSCNILHRDLKPRNVLVDSADRPYVTDFGLAKGLDSGPGMTRTGQVVGTPEYMAPEQAIDSSRARVASDVYSLGATLYDLLTGRPPFQSASVLQTLQQVIDREPLRPRQLNPAIDRDLETITLKCLEKEPGRRYATAAELADELRRYLNREPIRARPVGAAGRLWRWARRKPMVASLIAALLVVAALGFVGVLSQWSRAEATAENLRERLVRQGVREGARLSEAGDLPGSLVWFTDALRLDRGHKEEMHRFRLPAVWQHCPKLLQVWFHDHQVWHAEFSPDGSRVLIATGQVGADARGGARVWDLTSGQPVTPELTHLAPVVRALFSPDGKRVLTVSWDKTARVWDAATGQPLTPALQHQEVVRDGAFSRDGARVITASGDGTARIWDAATGKELTPPLKHDVQVAHASFSPDGRFVVTAGLYDGPGMAQVWDASTGVAVSPPLHSDRGLHHAEFSPDGRCLVTCSYDGTARVWEWDTSQWNQLASMEHKGVVVRAEFSPDGRLLATASDDATARVWNATTGQPVTPPLDHDAEVQRATFSPNGRHVLTASWDNTARVWDTRTGKPVTPALHHTGRVQWASFAPQGDQILTASHDGTARVWSLAAAEPPVHLLEQSDRVTRAFFSPNGQRVVTGSLDGTARIWDATKGRPVTTPLRHNAAVNTVAFSPDGRQVATGGDDGTARLWDASTAQLVGAAMEHKAKVLHVSFSPDGKLVVTACADGTVRVWDRATGKPVTPPLIHEEVRRYAAFSPDSRLVATAGEGGGAVWNASNGQKVFALPGARYHVCFSSDGTQVVAAGVSLAQVWDARSGRTLGPPLKHNYEVVHAEFSPDDRLVLTASYDGTVRPWNAVTGEPILPPLRVGADALRARFSRDGHLFVTAAVGTNLAEPGQARVWDTETGEPITPPLRHNTGVRDAIFSPDGRLLLTVSMDKTASIWQLPFDDRPVEDLVLMAELLAGRHLDSRGGFVTLELDQFHSAWQMLRAKYPKDFAVTNERVTAWHRREASESLVAEDSLAARFHLERLVELQPTQWQLRADRAKALVELGKWQEALSALSEAPESPPDGLDH